MQVAAGEERKADNRTHFSKVQFTSDKSPSFPYLSSKKYRSAQT